MNSVISPHVNPLKNPAVRKRIISIILARANSFWANSFLKHIGLAKINPKVNATTDDGLTSLHTAAFAGHKALARLLIVNGAKVNAGNYDGNTPLQFAAANGHEHVVKLLLANRANAMTRIMITRL